MRIYRIGIAVVVALSIFACSQRSTTSNPTAFCSAAKQNAVKFAGLQVNPTRALARKEAAAVQKLVGIAPVEIEPAVKTEAHAWRKWAKTGDHSELMGGKYAAANEQINMWIVEYCKQ